MRRSPVLIRAVAASPTPSQDAWLATRMAAWAVALPVLKHFVPVRVLARVMWKGGRRSRGMWYVVCGMWGSVLRHIRYSTTERSIERDPTREAQVVRLARWLSRATNLTKRGACLQQSLLAYRYLSELGADPRLMLAFHRNGGVLAGHAWVMVDGKAVTESSNDPAPFAPVVSFGPEGRILAV